jgi:hypothetical protein
MTDTAPTSGPDDEARAVTVIAHYAALKGAAALVKEHRMTGDDGHPLQVTDANAASIYQAAGLDVPAVFLADLPTRAVKARRTGSRRAQVPTRDQLEAGHWPCRVCADDLPARKYPTRSDGTRDTRCRTCRNEHKEA